MNDLFSRLGQLAQQAGNTLFSDAPGNKNAPQSNPSGSFSPAGDLMEKLKGSLPNGTGGMLGAGALGGILGALMSGGSLGKTVRNLGQGVLVAGGTAAAATLAWKYYQKWSQAQGGKGMAAETGTAASAPGGAWPTALSSESQSQGALSTQKDPVAQRILQAMVFAARSDGHIDDTERQAIENAMNQMFPGTDVASNISQWMDSPLDTDALARQVSSPEEARDLYRLSRMVITVDHTMERAYLDTLAKSLNISPEEQQSLDAEVLALQQNQQ